MLYAIIENGGKQYRAEEGMHIEVDLLPDEIGKKKTVCFYVLFLQWFYRLG